MKFFLINKLFNKWKVLNTITLSSPNRTIPFATWTPTSASAFLRTWRSWTLVPAWASTDRFGTGEESPTKPWRHQRLPTRGSGEDRVVGPSSSLLDHLLILTIVIIAMIKFDSIRWCGSFGLVRVVYVLLAFPHDFLIIYLWNFSGMIMH